MVFVLDKKKRPLMPCSEKRARLLLERGRARVHKMYPFTIRLVDRLQEDSVLQEERLKLDPGSKTTGVAVTLDGATGTKAVFLGEVIHKPGIKAKLDSRRELRRSRRNRKTRYRKPRFLNRKRKEGWLPPSLEARVNQTMNAVAKLIRFIPITAVSVEHVKFDTQLMQNAEISGVEYQQGELAGYEVREYLLEKWGRACVYCGATDVPLEVEHIVPKSRGGSNRVSNLTLACHECNQEKGNRTAEEFGHPNIQAQAKKPLKDAATMTLHRRETSDDELDHVSEIRRETRSKGPAKGNCASTTHLFRRSHNSRCASPCGLMGRWSVRSRASSGAVLHDVKTSTPRAVSAAKVGFADFHSMPDDPAPTVSASRGESLNGTFEAIERVSAPLHDDLKSFVVVVATEFTLRHGHLLFV